MKRSAALIASLLIVFFVDAALACRYTVRDIGFVSLRGAEFSLRIVVAEVGDLAEVRERLSPLAKTLDGSNIRLNVEVAAMPRQSPGDTSDSMIKVFLIDRAGRQLVLTPFIAEQIDNANNFRTVDRIDNELCEAIQTVLFPPVRQLMIDQSNGSFAQIIVIDGDNTEENERATQVANQASAAIKRIEPMLPRPIAFPVHKLRITTAQRNADPVLMWMFSSDSLEGDSDFKDAKIAFLAVVYGRGRLAGPVMSGDTITIRETLAQLALVGESCECETDRKWIDEPVLPFFWTQKDRRLAAEGLGFDPESPLVKAEMIRIVSQGPKSSREVRTGQIGETPDNRPADAIQRLLLGYTEAELRTYDGNPSGQQTDGGSMATAAETQENAQNIEVAPLTPVRAQIIQGDGWGFDEQDTIVATLPIESIVGSDVDSPSIDSISSGPPIGFVVMSSIVAVIALSIGGAWVVSGYSRS